MIMLLMVFMVVVMIMIIISALLIWFEKTFQKSLSQREYLAVNPI